MRHEKKSRNPAASARAARPKPVFAWEPYERIQPDIVRLLERHWREADVNHEHVPLDPNWEQYAYLDSLEWLYCAGVRIAGELVGYCTLFVNPHIHHRKTVYATVDVMYFKPDYRVGWTGVRFVRFIEAGARKLGAKVFVFDVKNHLVNAHGKDVGAILRFLNFNPVDVCYMKVLT